jgi:hypothetical protein
LALQVRTPLPEHSMAPGTHSPVQAPATQAWLVHGIVVRHVPVAPHVCTPPPEH